MARGWQSASIFILLVTAAMALPSPAQAADASAQSPVSRGEVLLMRAAGSGKVLLGGHLIDGPWTLAYDHGRLVVNGFALHPDPPLLSRLGSIQRAQVEFIDRAEALAESLRHSNLTIRQRQLRLVSFCEATSLGAMVDTLPEAVQLRFTSGANMLYPVGSVQAAGMTWSTAQPRDMTTREGRQTARLRELKAQLERGCVIFVTSSAGELIVPSGRAGEFMTAVNRFRSGAELDSADQRILSRQVRNQIRKPLPLDQVW